MGCLYMLGSFYRDVFFRSQALDGFGAAEVLREIVDLDDLLAQRFLALPLGDLFRGEDGIRIVVTLLARLAQLAVDRLARDGGDEGRLEDSRRVVAFGDVHAVGEPIARRARLERDLRALAVARVERRTERHAEREDSPAQQRGERLHREIGEDAVERLLGVVERVAPP